jgi:PAS domain S-box-containing protein
MQVTTAAAFGRSSAAPSGWRPPSRRRSLPVGVVVLAFATLALVMPHAGTAATVVLDVGCVAATALLLVVRAPRTSSPTGWRLFAASLVLSGAGAAVAIAVTGVPASHTLGSIPGHVVSVVAIAGMCRRGCWRTSRAHLITLGALFLVGTFLTLHVAMHFVPVGLRESVLLDVAADTVPAVASLATAAALLFAAGSGPESRAVAVRMLGAQALSAGAGFASLVAWAGGSSAARHAVSPLVLASLAVLTLACLRDRPAGETPTPEHPGYGAATDLLPHGMALVAGGLLLVRSTLTGGFGSDDGILALLMLVALVAHQAVMWRTQRALTRDLQRSESFFRTLVKSSVDPVVILDDQLKLTFASPSLWDLLGVDPAAAVGRSLSAVIHPDDAPLLISAMSQRRGSEATIRTTRLRHADGGWRLIQASVRDLRDDPDVGAIVAYCRDVTPRTPVRGVDPELLELALTDPVTGLPNRAALVRRLGAVQRGAGSARPAALALIGVTGLDQAEALAPGSDHAVLRALTSRLTRALRGEDWLARGKDGDFVVLVDGSIADAEVVASRLVANVGPLRTAAGPIELSAAAGVTALRADVDPGEALRRGSVALRSAQLAGAGSVHRYDDALRMQQDRSDALRADLDGAVARGELRLVFQPVIDLVLHRTVSVEALLRWRHPVFGDVPPVEFVPLAEQSPLIGDLGRWVLREACAAVAALPDTDLGVAVNVSARQVRSGELVPDVLAALESSGLPASRLIVEITESVLMDDGHVIEDLTVLRQLGVRIAVDDFGTGWSSLAYLVGLPIDVLKMDQHFVTDVEHDAQRQALCRSVLQLGSSLGLPVIVEGVTNEAELGLLRDMGHRFLQGFVFSLPLEAGQLAEGAWRTGITLPPPLPASRAEVAGAPGPAGP